MVHNRFGSWGICFTYGTFFAIKGLALSGRTYENSDAIRKACSFLLSKQLHTGGWGETYLSSETAVSVMSHYMTLWWICSDVIFLYLLI
jgi:squalene cyclase